MDYTDRYKGIDLEYFKSVMREEEFEKFINFIGTETIGVQEDDFEVFYDDYQYILGE